MNRGLRFFAPLDLVLVLLCAAGAALAIPLLRSGVADEVVMYRDNEVIAVYPQAEDRVVTVQGRLGPVQVAIARGSVRVTRVRCPKHLCAHSAPISRPGRQIVCAPNHILIQVRSGRAAPSQPDAIVR